MIGFTKATILGGHKLIGLCFGHQIIAVAMGGKVAQNPKGYEIGCSTIQLTSEGVKLFKLKFWKSKKVYILQMHKDIVTVVPPGFEVIGSNDFAACQIMSRSDRVLGIQGHMEFTPDYVGDIIEMRRESGALSYKVAQNGLDSLNKEADYELFAHLLLRFAKSEL